MKPVKAWAVVSERPKGQESDPRWHWPIVGLCPTRQAARSIARVKQIIVRVEIRELPKEAKQ